MKNIAIRLSLFAFLFAVTATAGAFAQGKGIDTQNKQIRDISNSQGPTDNGANKTTGTGRGIDFGAGKAVDRLPLPNPYRMASKRDLLLAMVSDLMKERNLVVDDAASRPNEGILITQPFTFAKGAIITASQLTRFAEMPERGDDAWTRGRYTLIVEVQTIDGTNNNVSVSAKIEGRSESALGSQWLTLKSSGVVENDFMSVLVERITGTSPNEPKK